MLAADDRTTTLETGSVTAFNLGWIWTISLVAALGGLLFGYDWVVIGGAKPYYEKYFHLTPPLEVGWAMSSALIGCLGGAILSGALADRFGRKRLLVLAGLIFMLSSIGTALAGAFTIFVLNRLAGGVGIGLASNLSPLYIAEIAPVRADPLQGRRRGLCPVGPVRHPQDPGRRPERQPDRGPRIARLQDSPGRGDRRGAGGLPAMVRH